MLLMLEDDVERLERFAATVGRIDPPVSLHVWQDAHAMIREAGPLLSNAKLISLDHDLARGPDASDPGNGLEVVKFLVSQPIMRPVIIHTSNSNRAMWMCGAFQLTGWRHWRVAPLGKEWIEWDWRITVEAILNDRKQAGTRVGCSGT